MAFADLSDDHRHDFSDRLQRLKLDENALLADELVVPASRRIVLSQTEETEVQPLRLVTQDLDEVRRWIGIPQAVLHAKPDKLRSMPCLSTSKRRTRTARLRDIKDNKTPDFAKMTGVKPDEIAKAVDRYVGQGRCREDRPKADHLEALRAAAHIYVRGDFTKVAELKLTIEQYFGRFEIAVWPFLIVRVKKNSVLHFGPGSNSLTVWKVIIEPGGIIRSHGHLTVDCTILEREPDLSFHLPAHVVKSLAPRRYPRFG